MMVTLLNPIATVLKEIRNCLSGVPIKILPLINNRTKAFCSTFIISFVLDRLDPNLDFDISVLRIGQKLLELR